MAKKKVDRSAELAIIDEALPLVQVVQELRPRRFIGRGNPASPSVQKLAREYTEDAFAAVLEIMDDKEAEPSTRLEAAKVVLDRGWGKASINIRAETIKYSMADLEKKLLEDKTYNDHKWEEARKAENEQLGRYIVDDAEIIEDASAHSPGELQDNQEGCGDSTVRLYTDTDAHPVPNRAASGEAIYGSLGDSEAETDYGHDRIERYGVQIFE